jgi:predicted nuclease of predicted toxin-antitoxin system
MQLLLDACVCRFAAEQLRAAGHDVSYVGEWAYDPGDDEILHRGVEESRILVTLDKDFGELVFVFHRPHGAIVRLSNIRARDQGLAILDVLNRFPEELQKNALVVVEPDRVRIRTPEVEGE